MGTGASVQLTTYESEIQEAREKAEEFPYAKDVTTLEEARGQLIMTRNLVVKLYKAYNKELLAKERSRKQKEKEHEMWVNNSLIGFVCELKLCHNHVPK